MLLTSWQNVILWKYLIKYVLILKIVVSHSVVNNCWLLPWNLTSVFPLFAPWFVTGQLAASYSKPTNLAETGPSAKGTLLGWRKLLHPTPGPSWLVHLWKEPFSPTQCIKRLFFPSGHEWRSLQLWCLLAHGRRKPAWEDKVGN